MRIGIVCPYSLTVPGGVQEQVLGLGRALRAKGHSRPGPRPVRRAAARRLGDPARQLDPQPANGSVAPIAPDAAAQLRLIRAVRDEEFDVLHLHEPLVPGGHA